MTPVNDLVLVLRRIFKFLRYLGFVFLGVTFWMIAREVWAFHGVISGLHPALGWVFLALVIVLVVRLLGVPVYRFFRMPAAISPPRLPDGEETWTEEHLEARREFLSRYLATQLGNPALLAQREEIRAAQEALGSVADRPALARFESETVNPILAPLDREVDRLIRAEALSVGVATAISPNGTLDAFVVLWRNANLVSRIANVYYGRAGVRGSLTILRDVSGAAVLATYLEGLSDAAGGILMGVMGSVTGVVAGPLVDGGVNAVATLRIGYLAKSRCRSFKAWTETTRKQAILSALGAAKGSSKEVLSGIARAAGSGVTELTGKVGNAVKDGVGGLLKKFRSEQEDIDPAGA